MFSPNRIGFYRTIIREKSAYILLKSSWNSLKKKHPDATPNQIHRILLYALFGS